MAHEFAQSPRTATPPKPPVSTEYPKWFYHTNGKTVMVKDAAEEAKLDKRSWGPKPHPVFTDEPPVPGDACKQCANMRAKFEHSFRQISGENAKLSAAIATLVEQNTELQYENGQLLTANRAYAEKEKERAFGEKLILPDGEFEAGPMEENPEVTTVDELLDRLTATAPAPHKPKKKA